MFDEVKMSLYWQREDLQPGRDRQGERPGAVYVAAPRTGAAATRLVSSRLRSPAAVELLARNATSNH